MNDTELMDLLDRAFTCGDTDGLAKVLSPDCRYLSEYSGKELRGAGEIINSVRKMHEALTDGSMYTCRSVPLADHLREGVTEPEECSPHERTVSRALLLFRHSTEYPCAAVSAVQDRESGLLGSILLSRSSKIYNVSFFEEEEEGEDSPLDLPSTVLSRLSRCGPERAGMPKGQLYIWREADEFVRAWLPDRGYTVLGSQVFDDCVGYRCARGDRAYTVYMYAYGRRKTVHLDGTYCQKLLSYELSADSTVLVVCLNVKCLRNGPKTFCQVRHYSGKRGPAPELWRVASVLGRPILEYYPRQGGG